MNEPNMATLHEESRNLTPSETEKKEDDTSSASPADKNEREDDSASSAEGKEDENKPVVFHAFHEHPRWIAAQNKLKEQEEKIQELQDYLEQKSPFIDQMGRKEEQAPEWFLELYGDDSGLWKKYQANEAEKRKELKEEILSEIRREQETLSNKDKEYQNWVDSEVQRLTSEGKKFDKNELMKIAVDYFPTKPDGSVNFDKAYELMTLLKTKPSNDLEEKKKLADKTIQRGNAREETRNFKTPDDFKAGLVF